MIATSGANQLAMFYPAGADESVRNCPDLLNSSPDDYNLKAIVMIQMYMS